jgi:Family of unknown function (DUF5652)
MNLPALFQNDYFLIALGVWELTWKGFALWRAAKNNHKYWFVPLLIINSMGLLPIIYLSIEWYKNRDLKKIGVFSRVKNLLRIK